MCGVAVRGPRMTGYLRRTNVVVRGALNLLVDKLGDIAEAVAFVAEVGRGIARWLFYLLLLVAWTVSRFR